MEHVPLCESVRRLVAEQLAKCSRRTIHHRTVGGRLATRMRWPRLSANCCRIAVHLVLNYSREIIVEETTAGEPATREPTAREPTARKLLP